LKTEDLIAIGEIIKAQGVRGELKIIPLTDNLNRFADIRRVYWKTATGFRELFLESYRPFKQFILLKFTGIDDMNAASSLGKGLIFIPRNERPNPPIGHYYYDQIEGLQVFTTGGEFLGTIGQIIATGSNDVYCINDKTKQLLIPALKNVVKEINLEEGRMMVEIPPGLVEDNS
jgi:16S rRNA processing protein RimM